MIDAIQNFIIHEPGYTAIMLMLFYTLIKTARSHYIEAIIGTFIIFSSIILQAQAFQTKIFEKMALDNKLSYYEKALVENNITASTYEDYIKKEQTFKKILSKQ